MVLATKYDSPIVLLSCVYLKQFAMFRQTNMYVLYLKIDTCGLFNAYRALSHMVPYVVLRIYC